MKSHWLVGILCTSFLLLSLLKRQEINALTPFFKAAPSIKLSAFDKHKRTLPPPEKALLGIWESMLTGRSTQVNKDLKRSYRALGLSHIFTPSGFHLSAVLMPVKKLLGSNRYLLLLYILLAIPLYFIPGLAALKRMLLIKCGQQLTGQKTGFFIAITLDLIWGSFQQAPLSMTYSFLFLGIIYSGSRGLNLLFWFFVAQAFLALFQNVQLSPLILFINPVLSMLFGMAMPVLFALSIPLWDWQVTIGLYILKILQKIVDHCFYFTTIFPTWEMSIYFVLIFSFLVSKRWKSLGITILILSGSLNIDLQKNMNIGTNEFVPRGSLIKIVYGNDTDRIYLSDGSCKRKLVRGIWFENCSPRKGSKHGSKKLSYR